MITPQEIELKEFTRAVRGYDRDEVDEFLDLIILDMQDLLKGMDELKKENQFLKEEIEEFKKSEKKVMETMETAKKLMKDMSDSAEKRADTIIQNAKMDAEEILNEARRNANVETLPTGDELHDKLQIFRSRYRQLLMDELESLDAKSGDLLTELEKEFIPSSLDTQILDFSSLPDDLPAASDEEMIIPQETAATNKDTIVRNKDTVILDSQAIDQLLADSAKDSKDNL